MSAFYAGKVAMTANDVTLWLDLFEKVGSVKVKSGGAIRAAAQAAAKAVRPASEYVPADPVAGTRARYRRDSPFSQLLARAAVYQTDAIQARAVLRGLVAECRQVLEREISAT